LLILVFLLLFVLLLLFRLCINFSSHFIDKLFLVLELRIELFDPKSELFVFFCLFIKIFLKLRVSIFKLQIFLFKLLDLNLRLNSTFCNLYNRDLVLILIRLLVRGAYLPLSRFNFVYFLLLFCGYHSGNSLFSFFRLRKLKILRF